MKIITYSAGPDGLPTIPKGVDEELSYSIDMSEYLAEEGDTLSEATVDLAEGLSKQGDVLFDATSVTVPLVSGGLLGQRYSITYRMVRAMTGEVVVRTVWLHIVPR